MSKIYVACLAAYNSGHLHGRWIDCSLGVDHIWEEVHALLAESPESQHKCHDPDCDFQGNAEEGDCPECGSTWHVAEEWAIHDHEFDGIEISECESFDVCADLAEAIDDHGEPFAIYWNHQSFDSVDDAIRGFQDSYRGCFDSLADYVQQYWDDCGYETSDHWWHPSNYTDWEQMAHDLQCGGDVWSERGNDGLHVFENC